MLHILFGEINRATAPLQFIWDIDGTFDYNFEDEWMQNDFAKEVIEVVDQSKLIAPKIIESPVLGTIIHEWISGGAKTLIMMYNVNNIVHCGNNLGDNCWPLLLKLSKSKDIVIDLTYYPKFDWVDNTSVHIINNNKIVNNFDSFLTEHLGVIDKIYEFSDIKWPIEIDYTKFE